jgi:thiol-disulfide isomerase/thioredoxin
MRRKTRLAAVFGGLVAAWLAAPSVAAEPAARPQAAQPHAAQARGVAWQKDLKSAQKLSAKTGRPIMVVFGAEWCTHCKRFEQTTLANPTMAGFINKEFIAVHLDYDKEEQAAQVLEVEALPCTVLLSPQADLLGKVVGAKPPKDFWEALQDARDEQARIRNARVAAASGGPIRR